MIYRTLGKTGLKVSALGFGAMRLPMTEDDRLVDRDVALPMIREAFEGGVNYIDTAVGYCNEDSQRVVGEALEAWFKAGHPRDSIVVSTKNPHYGKGDQAAWWRNLENSLERLRVGHIDVYHHHFLSWKSFMEHVAGPGGHYRQMEKARDRGLIRHTAFSWHDTQDNFLKVIETGLFESVTCQYNLLNRNNERCIARAHEKGMGVVIMGPVAGGRLGATRGPMGEALPQGIATTPELALRFVLSNPHVSVALSGMTRMGDVRENLATASDPEPLSAAEKAETEDAMQRLRKLADLYCTGCGYCQPCPQGVRIADIFQLVILYKVYGAERSAVNGYASMKRQAGKPDATRKVADACVECGECEEKCPQKIPIIQQLKDAAALLDRQ